MVATTERKYNSQKNDYYTEINITVENKTNEFVSFSFDFTGVQNKSVSGEVSPHGTWKSGARLSSGDCTGVEPKKKRNNNFIITYLKIQISISLFHKNRRANGI